jgi:hypothetical protein
MIMLTARQQQQAVERESNLRNGRGYRLSGKNLFFTWPQNDISKEVVMDRLLALFGDKVVFVIVCEEKHQSGEPHLHAVVSLTKRVDWTIRAGHRLDQVANGRGNYQAVRSLIKTVQYVTKEGVFVAHGVDVPSYLEAAKTKKNTTQTIMAKRLMDGLSIQDLNLMEPGFVMMNLPKLQAYQAQLSSWGQAPTLNWTPLTVQNGWSDGLKRLAVWLNDNLGVHRELRQKQLLLSSEPGMGKTWLVEHLSKYFRVFKHAGSKWFDGFDTNLHDIMVFDEFVGGVQASVMNKVVDGSVQQLEVKGAVVPKHRNIPVFVLTNMLDIELYPTCNTSVRAAFMDRFEYIRLEPGENPWLLFSTPVPMASSSSTEEVDDDSSTRDGDVRYYSEEDGYVFNLNGLAEFLEN